MNDVFVSYAHVDNVPEAVAEQGWVTDLVELLRVLLDKKAGRVNSARIWHDPVLRSNDSIDPVILQAALESKVFLLVVSQGYLQSSYCRKELATFCEGARKAMGLEIGGRSRLFVVKIDETARTLWPDDLQRVEGCSYYRENRSTGRGRLLRRTARREDEPDYWNTLEALASDIHDTIVAISPRFSSSPQEARRTSIYLAEATDDLFDDREKLRADLEQHGIHVEPAAELPRDPVQCGQAVQQLLGQCLFSVHMLSPVAGRPLGDSGKGISQIQSETAMRAARVRPYPMLWLPPGMRAESASNPAYRAFLGTLLESSREGLTGEVLQVDLEDLKSEIYRRLPQERPSLPSREGVQPTVYISYFDQTSANTAEFIDYFVKRRCAVSQLKYSEAAERRHRKWLALHDGLVIVYEQGTKSWAEDLALEARDFARGSKRPKTLAIAEVGEPCDEPFGIFGANLVRLSFRNGTIAGGEEFVSALQSEGSE